MYTVVGGVKLNRVLLNKVYLYMNSVGGGVKLKRILLAHGIEKDAVL